MVPSFTFLHKSVCLQPSEQQILFARIHFSTITDHVTCWWDKVLIFSSEIQPYRSLSFSGFNLPTSHFVFLFLLSNYKIFHSNNKISFSKRFPFERDHKSQINQIQVLQVYIQNLKPPKRILSLKYTQSSSMCFQFAEWLLLLIDTIVPICGVNVMFLQKNKILPLETIWRSGRCWVSQMHCVVAFGGCHVAV